MTVQIDVERAVVVAYEALDVFFNACELNGIDADMDLRIALRHELVDRLAEDSAVPFSFRESAARFAGSRLATCVETAFNVDLDEKRREKARAIYRGILSEDNLIKFYDARLNGLAETLDMVIAEETAYVPPTKSKKARRQG